MLKEFMLLGENKKNLFWIFSNKNICLGLHLMKSEKDTQKNLNRDQLIWSSTIEPFLFSRDEVVKS